jgi:hypothetical protein
MRGIHKSDAPFLSGLVLWLVLLGIFGFLDYPLLPALLGSAVGGIAGGFIVSGWQQITESQAQLSRSPSGSERKTRRGIDDTLDVYPLLQSRSRSQTSDRSSNRRKPLTVKDWLDQYGRK